MYEHAKATPAAAKTTKRMRTELMTGCIKAKQLLKARPLASRHRALTSRHHRLLSPPPLAPATSPCRCLLRRPLLSLFALAARPVTRCHRPVPSRLQAHALFEEMRQDGGLAGAAALGTLIEALCSGGHGVLAHGVLGAMGDEAMPLTSKACCQVLVALLRGGQLVRCSFTSERGATPAGLAPAATKTSAPRAYPPLPAIGARVRSLRALPRGRGRRRERGGLAAHRGLQRRARPRAAVQGAGAAGQGAQGVQGLQLALAPLSAPRTDSPPLRTICSMR